MCGDPWFELSYWSLSIVKLLGVNLSGTGLCFWSGMQMFGFFLGTPQYIECFLWRFWTSIDKRHFSFNCCSFWNESRGWAYSICAIFFTNKCWQTSSRWQRLHGQSCCMHTVRMRQMDIKSYALLRWKAVTWLPPRLQGQSLGINSTTSNDWQTWSKLEMKLVLGVCVCYSASDAIFGVSLLEGCSWTNAPCLLIQIYVCQFLKNSKTINSFGLSRLHSCAKSGRNITQYIQKWVGDWHWL